MLKDNMNAIEKSDDGNIRVSGELSFAAVPELNRRGCAFIQQNSSAVFDLDKVNFSDNSGVALLVSWVRCGKNMGRKILFVNVPQQLLDLVEASGLKEILPITYSSL